MLKRILIVDDDPNIRRIVAMALTDDSPYEVHAVSSGEAALLAIARQPVDLLFTDIRMPGMSGLELVKHVHELDPKTAVIVFTVSPEDLTPERAAELQIDCLLEKPISPERMRLAVDLLLDPIKLLPRPSQRLGTEGAPPQAPASTHHSAAPPQPPAPNKPPPASTRPGLPLPERSGDQGAPVTMQLPTGRPSWRGRTYSSAQIHAMRLALKEIVMEPDVQCVLLADISGIVLTHWSRRRDINVTAVAALAAGNTQALAEIGRNLGQRQLGHLVIHEGPEQSIIMVTVAKLLLLIAIGPTVSLGWARLATLRACDEILRVVRDGSDKEH